MQKLTERVASEKGYDTVVVNPGGPGHVVSATVVTQVPPLDSPLLAQPKDGEQHEYA